MKPKILISQPLSSNHSTPCTDLYSQDLRAGGAVKTPSRLSLFLTFIRRKLRLISYFFLPITLKIPVPNPQIDLRNSPEGINLWRKGNTKYPPLNSARKRIPHPPSLAR